MPSAALPSAAVPEAHESRNRCWKPRDGGGGSLGPLVAAPPTTPIEKMRNKVASPGGRQLYSRRNVLPEPVFGRSRRPAAAADAHSEASSRSVPSGPSCVRATSYSSSTERPRQRRKRRRSSPNHEPVAASSAPGRDLARPGHLRRDPTASGTAPLGTAPLGTGRLPAAATWAGESLFRATGSHSASECGGKRANGGGGRPPIGPTRRGW